MTTPASAREVPTSTTPNARLTTCSVTARKKLAAQFVRICPSLGAVSSTT
jgi:hypothetical protein